MKLTRTTAPAALVSTSDAKDHLRINGNSEDTYIDGLVKVAEAMLDGPSGMVGKALVSQRWTYTQERISGTTRLKLPLSPLISVVSLKYYDESNVQQTADVGSDYIVFSDEDYGYIEPRTAWPSMYDRIDALELVFDAGYGDVSDVPYNIIHAAKLMVGHWYENREDTTEVSMETLPLSVRDLVGLTRVGWIK